MSEQDAMNMEIPLPRATLIITQELLAEYHELGQLLQRRREIRDQIVELLDQHVEIAEGQFTARIRPNQSRQLTRANLTRLLGAECVAELREDVEPTVSRHLIVQDRSNAASSPTPRRPSRRREDPWDLAMPGSDL